MSAPALTAESVISEFAAIRRPLLSKRDTKNARVIRIGNSNAYAYAYGQNHGADALALAEEIQARMAALCESFRLPERDLIVLVRELRKGAWGESPLA